MLSRLRGVGIRARGHGQAKTSSREGFRHGFKGDSGQAIRQAQQGGDGPSQRMARQPDNGVGIELRDVRIQFASSRVVSILVAQSPGNAGVVAGVGARCAVTDLVPGPLSLLSAAATEEQVVVNLVVRGGTVPVKDSGRCALESDDNCRVGLISPDMATEAVGAPSEVGASVERLANFLPVGLSFILHVRIGGHVRQAQDGALVGDVGSRNLVQGPGGGVEDGRVAVAPGLGNHGVYHGRPPVHQTLYCVCAALGL